MSEKIRLDKFLTDAGLMASRSEAQAAITAGNVQVNGRIVTKASQKVSRDDAIEAQKAHPYVSRAALKLKGALEVFPVDVQGKKCLDVGSSTGGFTEVLLETGAQHVVSVDVGRDQFHQRLREDARITLLEQLDARHLTADLVGEPPQLIVCDASFIGLEKVLWPALSYAAERADLIALFKPQFQVGRKHVGKGGIVSNEEAVEIAFQAFESWLAENGWHVQARAPSPISGSDGNKEYLVWATNSRG
ncbi:MAG: TlyA family rRNA (cytidine-2'-O)-methyltransferase [Ponticaulis sp.]|nr:TlyA family rRNA (cytidine-2'-O)-methyltransferase [Ponticaulis sp.]|tara:strand:- start:9628 stop:10368 length:741 start_codon:yes stop_codon:yes gene_type:complete